MAKLEGLLQEETSQLVRLVRDENRFIQYYKQAIETSPLQVYASALVFSPVYSIVRNLFKQEEPEWITTNPPVENNWNACRQTVEGHNGSVASVAFSPDSRWLASASRDKTIKFWDPASGACTQTLKVSRVIYNLVGDPTGSHLYTDIGSIELNASPERS